MFALDVCQETGGKYCDLYVPWIHILKKCITRNWQFLITGTTQPNVAVLIRRNIVQIQRECSCVGVIIPIPATEESILSNFVIFPLMLNIYNYIMVPYLTLFIQP